MLRVPCNVIFIIDWKIYIYTFVRMAKFLIRDSYHRWLRVNQKNQCYGIYIDVLNSSEATLGQSSCNRFLRDYRTAAPGSPVGRWWCGCCPGLGSWPMHLGWNSPGLCDHPLGGLACKLGRAPAHAGVCHRGPSGGCSRAGRRKWQERINEFRFSLE